VATVPSQGEIWYGTSHYGTTLLPNFAVIGEGVGTGASKLEKLLKVTFWLQRFLPPHE